MFFKKRLKRLLLHLFRPYFLKKEAASSHPTHFLWWLLELLFYAFDLLFVPEILQFFHAILKPSTRSLTPQELAIAQKVYGDSLFFEKIRIDERAFLGPKQYGFAYVAFDLINSWGKMHALTFVHELMHIWQYNQMGSVYIPRALYAQRTAAGYDYGGFLALKTAMAQGAKLTDFNYEQQADLVADWYAVMDGADEERKSIYGKLCAILTENSQKPAA